MDFVQYDRPREVRDIEIVIQQFADGSLKDGDGVKVRGAVHRIKDMGDFAFVIIRSPRRTFQCIWETADAAQKLSPEDWVLIDGTIAADERSPLGFDIRISANSVKGGGKNVTEICEIASHEAPNTRFGDIFGYFAGYS